MEPIHSSAARQVWSRVTAPPDRRASTHDWPQLIYTAAQTLSLYQALAFSLAGKAKNQAQQLLELQQETLSTLRGLARLAQKNPQGIRPPKFPASSAEKLAVIGFRRAREAMTDYTARTIDPEFGPIFHILAQREETACATLASLLGSAF